jgi:hypothetical protein
MSAPPYKANGLRTLVFASATFSAVFSTIMNDYGTVTSSKCVNSQYYQGNIHFWIFKWSAPRDGMTELEQ